MKETKLTVKDLQKNERLIYALRNGIMLGVIFSLIKNRVIIWAILNGDSSNLNSLIRFTVIITIGGILGSYTIGWWGRKQKI